MATSNKNNREERAIDALMAAAFRAEANDKPVTEEQARRLVENPPAIGPEDERILASMEEETVDQLLSSAHHRTSSKEEENALTAEIEEAYAAMDRGDPDEEARQEIERMRREFLGGPHPDAEKNQKKQDGS